MSLTKIVSYDGSIDDNDRVSITIEPMWREVIEGNIRWQELSGEYSVVSKYKADGDTPIEIHSVLTADEIKAMEPLLVRLDNMFAVQYNTVVNTSVYLAATDLEK